MVCPSESKPQIQLTAILIIHLKIRAAKDFISQLLVKDVKYRKTIKGALLHDWIQLEYHSLCAAYKDRVARDGLGGKEYD